MISFKRFFFVCRHTSFRSCRFFGGVFLQTGIRLRRFVKYSHTTLSHKRCVENPKNQHVHSLFLQIPPETSGFNFSPLPKKHPKKTQHVITKNGNLQLLKKLVNSNSSQQKFTFFQPSFETRRNRLYGLGGIFALISAREHHAECLSLPVWAWDRRGPNHGGNRDARFRRHIPFQGLILAKIRIKNNKIAGKHRSVDIV